MLGVLRAHVIFQLTFNFVWPHLPLAGLPSCSPRRASPPAVSSRSTARSRQPPPIRFATSFAQIDVPVIPAPKGQPAARIAVALRNSLQYGLNGAAGANAPTYTLKVNVAVSALSVIVDITSGRPDAQVASIQASYQLIEIATGKTVLTDSDLCPCRLRYSRRGATLRRAARASAMPKTAPPRSSPTPSGTGWHRTSSPAPRA